MIIETSIKRSFNEFGKKCECCFWTHCLLSKKNFEYFHSDNVCELKCVNHRIKEQRNHVNILVQWICYLRKVLQIQISTRKQTINITGGAIQYQFILHLQIYSFMTLKFTKYDWPGSYGCRQFPVFDANKYLIYYHRDIRMISSYCTAL